MSGNDFKNRKDFRRRRKIVIEDDDWTSAGREFHSMDAATENERRPTVDRRQGGTWSCRVDADRSRRHMTQMNGRSITNWYYQGFSPLWRSIEYARISLFPLRLYACLHVCGDARATASVSVCAARACMRYIRRAHARLGEFVRGSCRVNVVAGLIAAECERRRRRRWTLCWRVSTDHGCVDDNCTVLFMFL